MRGSCGRGLEGGVCVLGEFGDFEERGEWGSFGGGGARRSGRDGRWAVLKRGEGRGGVGGGDIRTVGRHGTGSHRSPTSLRGYSCYPRSGCW